MDEDQPVEQLDAEASDLADSLEKTKLLRAMFSNRIIIQPDGLHLRMTFGERVGSESLFHYSIVVPNSDALEFGRLITRMAETAIEAQILHIKTFLADGSEGEASGG